MTSKVIKIVVLIAILFTFSVLVAQETSEQKANKAANSGDELYGKNDFNGAGSMYKTAYANYVKFMKENDLPSDERISKMIDNMLASFGQAENWNEYVFALKEKQKLNPSDWDNAKTIAKILNKKLNDIPAAIEFLKKFNSLKRNANAENMIGKYYKENGDKKSAIEWYRKSFELKPKAKTIKYIAQMQIEIGDINAAIKTYQEFLGTNPPQKDKIRTYSNLASLYDKTDNLLLMAVNLEKAVSLKYNKKFVQKLLVTYYDLKNSKSALEKVKQLISHNDYLNHAYYYRATIAYENGDKKAALKDFERITEDKTYGKIARDFVKSIKSEL